MSDPSREAGRAQGETARADAVVLSGVPAGPGLLRAVSGLTRLLQQAISTPRSSETPPFSPRPPRLDRRHRMARSRGGGRRSGEESRDKIPVSYPSSIDTAPSPSARGVALLLLEPGRERQSGPPGRPSHPLMRLAGVCGFHARDVLAHLGLESSGARGCSRDQAEALRLFAPVTGPMASQFNPLWS